MLRARTVSEAFLYLDMHPCGCGRLQFDGTHDLLESADGTVLRLTGKCPDCGADRHYEFILEPTAESDGEGARTPSALLDPGEYLWLSDRAAGRVPVDTGGLTSEQVEAARQEMSRAVERLEEVLAFIPADSTEVAPELLTSTTAQVLLDTAPTRFTRVDLTERIGLYRKKLSQLDDQLNERAD